MSVQLCFTEFAVGSVFNDFLADRFVPFAGFQVCYGHRVTALRRSLAAIFITTLLLFRLAWPVRGNMVGVETEFETDLV